MGLTLNRALFLFLIHHTTKMAGNIWPLIISKLYSRTELNLDVEIIFWNIYIYFCEHFNNYFDIFMKIWTWLRGRHRVVGHFFKNRTSNTNWLFVYLLLEFKVRDLTFTYTFHLYDLLTKNLEIIGNLYFWFYIIWLWR